MKSTSIIMAAGGLFLFWAAADAQSPVVRYFDVEVVQSRGADPAIDYESLKAFGPWDDRNYLMTQADLDNLAPDEAKLREAIPAFFRAEYRARHPHMSNKGGEIYPRSAFNEFRIQYEGYLIDGKVYRKVERVNNQWRFVRDDGFEPGSLRKFLDGESRVSNPSDAAESAIAINPVNNDIVIAGSNGPGAGQKMYQSADGGETWTSPASLPLGGTCCDPTVGWSSDGTLAYTSTLGNCGGGCSIWFYRSDDNGLTWTGLENETPGDPRRELTNGGSDKEYLHVDTFPTSPHIDNVYLTWHDGNVMKFARSTDFGNTFDPVISFDSQPRGIGSDIATDKSGNVYYFYPAFTSQEIIMLKSTDGGATFGGSATTVASTEGSFIFPVPSMETREVFIYASADTDFSNGTFADSIYVAWTDSTGATTSNPANNVARIQVAYSRDGGSTWSTSTPHSTSDPQDVDRYHQWLDVDENGVVHVIFYDTSEDLPNRNAVDVFYTYSDDGAQSWATPVRVTSEMSPNISDGFEFGDYNGMDIVGQDLIAIFTDNRNESGGGGNSVDVYAAAGFGVFGDGFSVSSDPAFIDVCTPVSSGSTIDVGVIGSFTGDVDLDVPTPPAGFTNTVFSPATVAAPGTSNLTFDVAAAAGDYALTVVGTSGMVTNQSDVLVSVFDGVPAAPALSMPADGATGVLTSPTLSWSAVSGAQGYLVEIATDSGFTNVVVSESTLSTSLEVVTPLAMETEYFWRVTATNACGTGIESVTRSFTTGVAYCSDTSGVIPNAGSVVDVLNLAGTREILNLRVSLLVTHAWIGDVTVNLAHDGTDIDLINRPGIPGSSFGCNGPNIDAIFDDAAALVAETDCSSATGLTGEFVPNEALSAFDGDLISGDWTLTISDAVAPDPGVREEWCLFPEFAAQSVQVTLDGSGSGTVSSNPAGISCPGDCGEDYADMTMVELTATPAGDSEFTGWSGGGCSGTGTCTVTTGMASTLVTATFETAQLDVTLSGTGSGSVSSMPSGISCPADCGETYVPGSMVTLSAASDGDSTFVGWTGGGCSGTSDCVVTLGSDTTVDAEFELVTFPLTVTLAGAGSGIVISNPAGINCGSDCAEDYSVGTMVTLNALPAIGAGAFAGWSGGGCSGTGSCVVTVNAATEVTATFDSVESLDITVTGDGIVSSSPAGIDCPGVCSADFVTGTMVTLTASKDSSTFVGWIGGGCSGTGDCVVSMDSDVSVEAIFESPDGIFNDGFEIPMPQK